MHTLVQYYELVDIMHTNYYSSMVHTYTYLLHHVCVFTLVVCKLRARVVASIDTAVHSP